MNLFVVGRFEGRLVVIWFLDGGKVCVCVCPYNYNLFIRCVDEVLTITYRHSYAFIVLAIKVYFGDKLSLL